MSSTFINYYFAAFLLFPSPQKKLEISKDPSIFSKEDKTHSHMLQSRYEDHHFLVNWNLDMEKGQRSDLGGWLGLRVVEGLVGRHHSHHLSTPDSHIMKGVLTTP